MNLFNDQEAIDLLHQVRPGFSYEISENAISGKFYWVLLDRFLAEVAWQSNPISSSKEESIENLKTFLREQMETTASKPIESCSYSAHSTEAQQDDIDRIIDNHGALLLEAMNAATMVCEWLHWVVSARARLPRLTCAAGPTCFRLCVDSSDFCENHKCETEGCSNPRERAFHHCEVHP